MRRYSLILLCMAAIVGKCFDASPLLQWVLADADAEFSPLDIDDCAMWLDASDSDTVLHTSNAVTNWINKADSDCSLFVAGGTSLRPTTNTRTKNDLNVIDFDGYDYLKNNTCQVSLPITTFIVCEMDAVAGMSLIDSANASFRVLIQSTATGTGKYRIYSSSLATSAEGGAYTAGGYNLLRYAITSDGTQTLHNTNVLQVSHNNITQGYDGIVIGTDATPSPYFNGAIAEVIIYGRTLTVDQTTQVETYLSDKWGIE